MNPAASCQLSNADRGSDVRPRATGLRNESSREGVFVICGYTKPASDSPAIQFSMLVSSLDGVSRTVNCTAVTGLGGLWEPVYSTKSVLTWVVGSEVEISWKPRDFGARMVIPYSYSSSLTCLLPPQTAILAVFNRYQVEIGE